MVIITYTEDRRIAQKISVLKEVLDKVIFLLI